MTPPIEIDARKLPPLGMTPARFLRDYWQKRPLLIRGAFADFADPLAPEDLAGLACEDTALSRIVVHETARDRWTLRNGPFAETDFSELPKRSWTVLVQDVDKWDADVAALLAHFAFVPSWRIDDTMVSYAVDGGSVGAHVDHYDVFLLQGLGRRRWQIDASASAPREFRDDADLKLLRAFTPTHEWTLDAGDMLYLPPEVPHHGIAIGACMTYSIGMRAPSQAELTIDFAETLADAMAEECRFGDADLAPSRGDGEIDADAIRRVAAAMPWLRVAGSARASSNRSRQARGRSSGIDDSMLSGWFGRFITRYRSAHTAAPPPRKISDAALANAIASKRHAVRNPWSRTAWIRSVRAARLFVAGDEHACSIDFARRICGVDPIPLDAITSARDRDVLRVLIDAGHIAIERARRARRPR